MAGNTCESGAWASPATTSTVTGCLKAGEAANTYVLTTSRTADGTAPATYQLTGAYDLDLQHGVLEVHLVHDILECTLDAVRNGPDRRVGEQATLLVLPNNVLDAFFRQAGVGQDGGERLSRVRILHVLQARAVTALALHVVVALVSRGRKPAGLGRQVAQLIHRVAVLTERLRMPAALQRRPRIRVRRLLPLPLEADVAVAAHRQVRRRCGWRTR